MKADDVGKAGTAASSLVAGTSRRAARIAVAGQTVLDRETEVMVTSGDTRAARVTVTGKTVLDRDRSHGDIRDSR